MKVSKLSSSSVAVLATAFSLALAGCDKSDTSKTGTTGTPSTTGTTSGRTDTKPMTPPKPDNTEANKDHDVTKTPLDQGQNATDIKITADIRRAIMDDKAMSTNAQNCKVISENGTVTLRGVVDSQMEKDAIAAKAKAIAGVMKVDNQLEVKVK